MPSDPVTPETWQSVLESLRGKVSPNQFDTWFRDIRLGRQSAERVEIVAPTAFVAEWLGKKYASVLREVVAAALGWTRVEISVTHDGGGPNREAQPFSTEPLAAPVSTARTAPQPADTAPRTEGGVVINREYTFENFVVGPHNELAVAAARAVVENRGRLYNPLFVYGRVGLGKTHLLQAICHALLSRTPRPRIVYVSCEFFINQFISAVEKGDLESFRGRYRDTDVFLVDDVHFLANKDRSQEEFFHTFNALHQLNKQIILSSDSPPPEIPTLSERLVSRFKQGMVCELEPPLFETRIQIASRKASQLGCLLPDDVLDFIAQNVQSNIRELEGAVTRVVGKSTLMKLEITLAMAREALSDLLTDRRRKITLDEIVNVVTEHFGLRRAELQSKRRTKALTEPRQVCMYVARKLTSLSLEEIGVYFGGRDHSTVLYGADRVQIRMNSDPDFRRLLEELAQRLGGSLQG